MTFPEGPQDLWGEQRPPQHRYLEPGQVPPDLTQQGPSGARHVSEGPGRHQNQVPPAYPLQQWGAPAAGYGQGTSGFGQQNSPNTPAMWAYLGALLTWAASVIFYATAWFSFVIPLIIRSKWKSDPFVRHHSTQALNSALTGLVLGAASTGLAAVPAVGRLIQLAAIGFAIARAVFEIIGSVKARKGERFPFPIWVAFRFIKDDTTALSLRRKVAVRAACALALVLTVLNQVSGSGGMASSGPHVDSTAPVYVQQLERDGFTVTGQMANGSVAELGSAKGVNADGLEEVVIEGAPGMVAQLDYFGEQLSQNPGITVSFPQQNLLVVRGTPNAVSSATGGSW